MKTVRCFLRNNGLSLFVLAMFIATFAFGQIFTGWKVYNDERRHEHQSELSFGSYLKTPHFLSATGENWESEFLQLFVYVVATTLLIQRGSAESNDPDRPSPPRTVTANSPWPVRRGGLWLKLYAHSLSLAFATLFIGSFALHAWASTNLENEERVRAGEALISVREHLTHSQFWFESFQNWQSEFLAIGSVVVLTIFLREDGSPESKAVAAPHDETGK